MSPSVRPSPTAQLPYRWGAVYLSLTENLNREFRRRTKTQASFSSESAAVTLLYSLVAFGQIRLHRITGYGAVKALLKEDWTTAA